MLSWKRGEIQRRKASAVVRLLVTAVAASTIATGGISAQAARTSDSSSEIVASVEAATRKAAQAQAAAEKVDADRVAAERAAAQRAEAERVDAERLRAEQLEAERAAAERAEAERVGAELAAAQAAQAAQAARDAVLASVESIAETSMWATASVNVRTGPGTEFDKVSSLTAGMEIRVNGKGNGFYRTTDGTFVSGQYLSVDKPEPKVPTAPPATAAKQAGGGALDIDAIVASEAAARGVRFCGWGSMKSYGWIDHTTSMDCFWLNKDRILGDNPSEGMVRDIVRHEAAHIHIGRSTGNMWFNGTDDPYHMTNGTYTFEMVTEAYAARCGYMKSWTNRKYAPTQYARDIAAQIPGCY